MARQIALLFMMIMLVGCTDNTRPVQSDAKKTDAELQQMAAAHNANVKDPTQKVVCERVTPIGSRISHRECHTVWQADQNRKDAKAFVNMPRAYPTDAH